jgi:hypothetical protein
MCKTRKDLCVYGSRVACQTCQQRKVRCSSLDAKRKRNDEEIDSEEDGEPSPKRPRSGPSKPLAVKPTVEISGPSQAAKQPVIEMVGLLRELVEEFRELWKITRGVAGLGTQIYQQNAKLVRLGERQSYLAEKALKKGSGSGSEAGGSGIGEARKDKGKGNAEMTKKDETMRSDGDSDSEEDLEKDARQDEDVLGSVADSGTEK